MTYLVCLPYAYQPYFDACRATMKFPEQNMLLIDNTVKNVGIMRAHNMGAQRVLDEQLDWLVIVSAAVRFGDPGGLDFIQVLADHMDHYVIHAATQNVVGGKQQESESGGRNGVFGWHLTAFKREVFENIGLWDENFSPYGFDDIDLSIRIQKHYKGKPGWDTYPVDVTDTTMSHSINLANVKSPSEPKIAYFKEKWGRYHGEWQIEPFDHPFNDSALPLSFWPQAGHQFANKEAWEFLHANA